MPKVSFLGKVFPEAYQLSISSLPIIRWESPDVGLTWLITIKIEKNVVTIECDVNRYSASELIITYMRAFDQVRSAINLAAFATGIGFSVVIDTLIDQNGRQTAFALKDDGIAALCTMIDLNASSSYSEVFNIVATEPALFQALDDLIVSISLPHHSVVNCARAIEGIRHMIAPGKKEKVAWIEMRRILNISEPYLRMLTDHSPPPRHGDRTHIPGAITMEIVKRSWRVMNRFLEYRKRGNKPLPEAEFPTLV